MRVIDLSWPVTDGMAVFPGDVTPSVKTGATIEENGFRTTLLSLSSHAGTHMDAPAHMMASGKYLDEMPGETFFGIAVVADVRGCAGRRIELADIKVSSNEMACADFLLFLTGWSRNWGKDEYFEGFPTLSPLAAEWVSEQRLKGVGFDSISADPVSSVRCDIHKILLGKGIVIIENLRNLEQTGYMPFCLAALPISIVRQDGGPARVMAVLDR